MLKIFFEKVEAVSFYGKEINGKETEIMDIGFTSFDIFNKDEILKDLSKYWFRKIWMLDLTTNLGFTEPYIKVSDWILAVKEIIENKNNSNKVTNHIFVKVNDFLTIPFTETYVNMDFVRYHDYKTETNYPLGSVKDFINMDIQANTESLDEYFNDINIPIKTLCLDNGEMIYYAEFPELLKNQTISFEEYTNYFFEKV